MALMGSHTHLCVALPVLHRPACSKQAPISVAVKACQQLLHAVLSRAIQSGR